MIGKICSHLNVDVKTTPFVGLQIDESHPMSGAIAQLSREGSADARKVVDDETPGSGQNRVESQAYGLMPSLDFDGDYGRTYKSNIRDSVPGYDTLHEIGLAAVRMTSSQSLKALVVGPGPGENMPSLLEACPKARFTLLEPSEQMLAFCKKSIDGVDGMHRCQLQQNGLMEACKTSLKEAIFDLVICHNVLHLFNGDQQTKMLHQLAALTGIGGTLLLSAFSEPEKSSVTERFLALGGQRLKDRGLTEEQVSTLLASRNQVVFSVDEARVRTALGAADMASPLQLYQALFAKLWLIQRPN